MQKGEKSFLDTLYEMTELEIADKNKRAMNACVKVANFPFIKTVDDFNFSFQPSLRKEEIIGYTDLRFIKNVENLLFIGSPGVEKHIYPYP